MPKLLIVSATKHEIQPLLKWLNIAAGKEEGLINSADVSVSVLITGVGMVNTAFNLGKYLDDSYDDIINAGICGAFKPALKIGELVNVNEDCLCEMGAEDGREFIKYADLKLGGTNAYTNKVKAGNIPCENLKKVKGITVNTVHGNDESIKKTISLFNPDVESMEGAAFFRSCQYVSANYWQVRSVSNYVEKRDKSKWNIPLAIGNLNDFLIKNICALK